MSLKHTTITNSAHQAVLTTRHLTVGYRKPKQDQVLFKDLSIELPAGKLVCFMGPNGIGKSSLIRTLAGLQKPLGGEVLLQRGDNFSKQLAVVLTDRIAAPNMTVFEVVAYGRYPYLNWNLSLSEHDNEAIEQAIDCVKLRHLRNEKVYALSDGQLQMVMIARAIAQDTSVILLDEPTAHLDLNNRLEIMKLLKRLTGIDRTILIATHDLDLALQMADMIWLAGPARKIITGIPEDLVLNGAFDAIFRFKGFDLKTGKVHHEVTQSITITLKGDGYEYLWTKNALERCGYRVVSEDGAMEVVIDKEGQTLTWRVVREDHQQQCISIEQVISLL